MKLPRGLLALTAAALIVPAGWTASRAHPAGVSQAEAAGDRAAIQGKTVGEWLAALKDQGTTVRRRAVEVLGEYAYTPAVNQDERLRLMTAVESLMFSDRDAEVRDAAGFFSGLERVADSPERLKQALEEWKRAVKPTSTAVRLVDTQGRPVAGALAGDFLFRDADHEAEFRPMEPSKAPKSDERGELSLKLEVPGHLDVAAVYAIRRDGKDVLVGARRVTRGEIRGGRPITVEMHPACRVRLRIDCPGFRQIEEKFHVDLRGDGWWRAAYVWLGENHESPRPLFTSSTNGELEFLLPPGRYMIMAYSSETTSVERVVEVKLGHRVLTLGVLEVSPVVGFEQGWSNGLWRSIRRDPGAAPGDRGVVTYRRPRRGPLLRGDTRNTRDVAYSPDGKLLATAHSHNEGDPGEVRLWDPTTGAGVATIPVAARGVLSLAFSPDGKLLAGRVYPMAALRSSSQVAIWDVASRRELRTLGDPDGWIADLAFSPDGRTLATCDSDRALRLWDVASGRETRRVDGMGLALAFAPDGRTLATTGADGALVLWDVTAGRPAATLEPASGTFTATGIAFSPDGRSLAAIGWVPSADGQNQLGRAYLYDLSRNPPARRAQLIPAPAEPGRRERTWINAIAFTPDGQRVVGLAAETLLIWDAATGAERDSLERAPAGIDDRLAVSPDGRWLAVTQEVGTGVGLIDIDPTIKTWIKVPNVNLERRGFTGY